jgi:hypothetical protein
MGISIDSTVFEARSDKSCQLLVILNLFEPFPSRIIASYKMSTDTATQSRIRRLFQRLRNITPHWKQAIPSGSSISTEPPGPTGSGHESSVLSGPQAALGSESVPAARPSSESNAGTTTSPAQGPAATSTLCRGIVEKALERLEASDRVIIQEYVLSNDIASAVVHAFEAAEAKRKVCESKRWTFTVGSHTLNLQEEADKVILWLDRFKQVGDVAANADPVQAGLPWAGVRLLLEVCRTGPSPFYIVNHVFIVHQV